MTDLTPEEQAAYDRLDEYYTDPSTPVRSAGKVLTGEAAAAHGRQFVLDATGASTLEEAIPLFIGRPKKGTERGPAPVVRGRVTAEDRAALNELIARTGKTESELVREAIHNLLQSA